MELNRDKIMKCLRHCNGGDCETCKVLGTACDASWTFHKDALTLIKQLIDENDRLKENNMKKYGEVCTDNRFELIKKYKEKLIEATNIKTSKKEMAVIDNILFRFWQMGWLDKLEDDVVPRGKYENLEREFKALDIECERLEKVEENYHKVKTEVVEMLNEIEDNFEPGYGGVYEFKRFLAKLKKKYIGEELWLII